MKTRLAFTLVATKVILSITLLNLSGGCASATTPLYPDGALQAEVVSRVQVRRRLDRLRRTLVIRKRETSERRGLLLGRAERRRGVRVFDGRVRDVVDVGGR